MLQLIHENHRQELEDSIGQALLDGGPVQFCFGEEVKKVALRGKHGKGKFAIVDDDIYEAIKDYNWSLRKGYVVSTMSTYKDRKLGIKHKVINLHHIVLPPREGMDIDHTKRNKLDNRRSQLRYASRSVNSLNRRLSKQNISGHRGVGWDKIHKKWRASIKLGWKQIHIGRFDSIDDAIKARKDFELVRGIKVYD